MAAWRRASEQGMRHSRFARGAGWSRTEWRGGSRNAARGGSLGARGRGFSSKKMVRVGETLYSKSGTALFKRDANSINDATRAACQQNSRGWKPRGVGRGIVRGRARYSWSRVHRGRGLPRSRGITKYSSRQRLFLGRGLARGGRREDHRAILPTTGSGGEHPEEINHIVGILQLSFCTTS